MSYLLYRVLYRSRVYYALLNRCWRCLLDPFHD